MAGERKEGVSKVRVFIYSVRYRSLLRHLPSCRSHVQSKFPTQVLHVPLPAHGSPSKIVPPLTLPGKHCEAWLMHML